MKILFSLVVFTLAPAAFAGQGNIVYSCSNDERSTHVNLREVEAGKYEADVTVEAARNSVYTFRNVQRLNGFDDPARGSPITFAGDRFKLVIRTVAPGRPALLSAPSIWLVEEEMNCN